MIALYATGFNTIKFYTLRTDCSYTFCTVLRTETIFLHSIALLVFINATVRLL
jgi:hypothetical protein